MTLVLYRALSLIAMTLVLYRALSLSLKSSGKEAGQKLTRRYSRGADEFHSAGYTSSRGLLQTVSDVSQVAGVQLMHR